MLQKDEKKVKIIIWSYAMMPVATIP